MASTNDQPVTAEAEGRAFERELLQNLPDGVYFVDSERHITYWNRAAEQISGFEPGEVVGRQCFDNILRHVDDSGRLLCAEGCPLAATIADGKTRSAHVYLHHRRGHRVPVSVKASAIRDSNGRIVGAVETFHDDSPRAEAVERSQRLQQEALLDPLTGVGNRRYAEAMLANRLDEMNRYGWPFALLFIDVDHFKQINDQHGHDVGDRVLGVVARTLTGLARAHDFVGRWGGEEFVMLVAGVDPTDLGKVAERVRVLVQSAGLRGKDRGVDVSVSIGAVLAQPGDTSHSLVRRADQLMYRSKLGGRNRVTL
jgi:diguanylate cyclase (GGDEF)-like protein/PAS domain S-box-containing protein